MADMQHSRQLDPTLIPLLLFCDEEERWRVLQTRANIDTWQVFTKHVLALQPALRNQKETRVAVVSGNAMDSPWGPFERHYLRQYVNKVVCLGDSGLEVSDST
eukprot:3734304-Amphidinium_carterae.1